MLIWIFGDSWTFGAELWNHDIEPSIETAIARWGDNFTTYHENQEYITNNRWSNFLDYDNINFAQPGSSNIQILEILENSLQSHERPDVIIIAWTTQYRWAIRVDDWKNKDVQMRHKSSEVPISVTDNVMIDMFYNTVATAHWLANGIPIININAFYKNQTNLKFDSRVYFSEKTLLEVATEGQYSDISKVDWHWLHGRWEQRNKGNNLKPQGHPDETGHKLIAKYINNEIRKLINDS